MQSIRRLYVAYQGREQIGLSYVKWHKWFKPFMTEMQKQEGPGMVDVLLLQTVSITVASTGVFLAAIYYILQIRHQTKMRQTDMVMRLYAAFGSSEFQKMYQDIMSLRVEDYADYMKKHEADAEVRGVLYSIGTFFEGVGVLAKRKLIDMDLVDDLFSTTIKQTWELMATSVKRERERRNSPAVGKWFEFLYDEMKKREQAGVKNG